MSTMGNVAPDFRPKPPARRSLRKANVKKTAVIRHQLLLEPTLERQERKRRLREKELAKHQAPQLVKQDIELDDDDLPISKIIIPRRKVSPVTPDMVLIVKATQEAKRKPETKKDDDLPISKIIIPRRKVSPVAPDMVLIVKTTQEARREPETKKAASKTPVDKIKTRVKKTRTRIEKSMTRADKTKNPERPLRIHELAPAEEERTDELVPKQRTPQRTPVPSPPPASSPVHHVSLEQFSLDQLRIELAMKKRLTVLRRRKVAMQALMTAADMTSIFASLAVVKDIHRGDELHPVASSLVNDAQITGELLLTRSLVDRFTSPRSFGGLAFSHSKAQILINHLFQTIVPSFGTIPITAEILVATGFPVVDSIELLPHIRVIVDDIRAKISSLANVLVTVTGEESLFELVARTHRI